MIADSTHSDAPVAFLCHATEDKDLARKLANDLTRNGVRVFFDEWEIRSGDSIVEKINRGLEDCTHFIALLTDVSLEKPWVRTEMDAAFVNKIQGDCQFIALRHNLSADKLPLLLKSLLSPPIDNYDVDFERLVNDIFHISLRPQLGLPPERVGTLRSISDSDFDLSVTAAQIVGEMIENSKDGDFGDPSFEVSEMVDLLNTDFDGMDIAIDELVEIDVLSFTDDPGSPIGIGTIVPKPSMFCQFDKYFMPWDPEDDARRIAVHLVQISGEGVLIQELAKSFNWLPRRMNPAVSFLIENGIVESDNCAGTQPFTCAWIMRTPKTKRYAR